jgi:DNA-binding IclR family transcriptional regulator
LIGLSRSFLDKLDYREALAPLLERLARETRTTSVFGTIDDDRIFVVAKSQGWQDINVTLRLGQRFPVTGGAHGKAIVAFMPEEERKKILKGGKLFFHGAVSKLDRKRLKEELAQCRADGFAVDIGELNPGINAIAAPVFGAPGKLMGTIFIVGTFPESRIAEYGPKVAERAAEASALFGAERAGVYRTATAKPAGARV